MIYVFWIAITTDGWTSRATESYITVTSTRINKNWELEKLYFTDTDYAREPYRYVFLFQQPTEKSHSIVFTI